MAVTYIPILFGLLIVCVSKVSVEANCAFPVEWRDQYYYNGYSNGLANFIFINDTVFANLFSGFVSVCNDFNSTAGIISFTDTKENNIKEQFCQEVISASNALFTRKSPDVTQDAALTLDECVISLGERTQFKAYIVFPAMFETDKWGTNVVADGTYAITYSNAQSTSCSDPNAKLTIAANTWTASSTCITGQQTYTNPMAGDLFAVSGLADIDLSVASSSSSSGIIILAMQPQTPPAAGVDYKFFLARFQVVKKADKTSFLEIFFTTDEADDPTGYISENKIPTSAQEFLVKTTLTSNECDTSNCNNGGTCIQEWLGYTCSCPPGFQGSFCETDIDDCNPNPCQNGGTCTDKVNGFDCECSVDFDGSKCQLRNACGTTNPCQNGATCMTIPNGGAPKAYCNCADEFYGEFCQHRDLCADEPCENGATCYLLDKNDFYCFCPSGLSGKKCDTANNGTTCETLTCQNGGECLTNEVGAYCQCDVFFDGDFCEELSDWFIVALVLLILLVLIIVILLIVCCCFCCCGWRPNSTANYETMNNSESSLKMDAPQSSPGTVEFNFSPASPYYGIQMLGSRK